MEETNYDRKPLEYIGSNTPSPGFVTPREGLSERSPGSDIEKKAVIRATDATQDTTKDAENGSIAYHPKTYIQKLRLLDKPRPFNVPRLMLRPLIFLTFPVIAYAGFSYGSNLVWFNVLNATTSLILSGSPYNFSSSMVGLSYVSPLLGVAAGSAYSGFIGDKIVLYLARRNKGVLEPEQRLWLFALSALFIPASLILWGVGAAHHIHWFGLIVAMFLIAITNSIGVQLSVSYAVDSYKDLSGEAMVTVILIRNTMSFAIGYGVTPWIDGMGLQNAFLTAAGVGLAQVATFLIVVKYGKKWRIASRARYWRFVEESIRLGVGAH